jgi:hypothetical protein
MKFGKRGFLDEICRGSSSSSLFPSFSDGRCEGKRAKKAPCRAQLRERESCCERGIGVGVFCCCSCLLFPLQSSSRGARNTQESFVLFLCP